MKPIVGVFGNDKHLQNVLDELYRRDFKQADIQVIEPEPGTKPPPEAETVTAAAGGASQQPAAMPPVRVGTGEAVEDEKLHEDLRELGLPEAEVEFYAKRLRHGSSLLLIQNVEEEQLERIEDILREAQATNL